MKLFACMTKHFEYAVYANNKREAKAKLGLLGWDHLEMSDQTRNKNLKALLTNKADPYRRVLGDESDWENY